MVKNGKTVQKSGVFMRLLPVLLCMMLMLYIVQGVCVKADEVTSGTLTRMEDQAGILTEEEEKKLNDTLDTVSEKQECDVAVVTVNSLEGKTAQEYADDFYEMNGYGYGEDKSGILLLVAMDDREWHMSTCGYGITAFTDAGLSYMEDQFVPDMSDGEYAKAFTEYASLCDEFLTQAKTKEPYDSGHLPKGKVSPIWILGDLLIGGVIAFVMAMVKKSKLKSVKSQVEAAAYEKAGSLHLTEQTDHFVNRIVTTRKIERKTQSSGSSTHTSSSGTSHGGSGGKF